MTLLSIALVMLSWSFIRKAFRLKTASSAHSGRLYCALFVEGFGVSAISGTVLSTTYSKNKGGSVIRNRRVPINRRSVGQSNQRQSLGNGASAWRGLSQANRDSWNAASGSYPYQNKLGQTKYLSGMQLYVQFNQNSTLIGGGSIDTAPAPGSFPTLTAALTVADTPSFSLAFTTSPVPTGTAYQVYATAPLSPGVGAPGQSKFRSIGTIAAAATTPWDGLTAYQAVFGDPIADQKIFVEIKPILTTGQAGTPIRTSAIVS